MPYLAGGFSISNVLQQQRKEQQQAHQQDSQGDAYTNQGTAAVPVVTIMAAFTVPVHPTGAFLPGSAGLGFTAPWRLLNRLQTFNSWPFHHCCCMLQRSQTNLCALVVIWMPVTSVKRIQAAVSDLETTLLLCRFAWWASYKLLDYMLYRPAAVQLTTEYNLPDVVTWRDYDRQHTPQVRTRMLQLHLSAFTSHTDGVKADKLSDEPVSLSLCDSPQLEVPAQCVAYAIMPVCVPVFLSHAQQTLYCYSPALLPRPDNWSQHIHVVGPWLPHKSLNSSTSSSRSRSKENKEDTESQQHQHDVPDVLHEDVTKFISAARYCNMSHNNVRMFCVVIKT